MSNVDIVTTLSELRHGCSAEEAHDAMFEAQVEIETLRQELAAKRMIIRGYRDALARLADKRDYHSKDWRDEQIQDQGLQRPDPDDDEIMFIED